VEGIKGILEVLVAALFHDIGKFGQRAGEPGKHPEISRRFVESFPLPEEVNRALAAELVSRHHDRSEYPDHLRVSSLPKGSVERTLARIVSEADNLSSAMDRETDEEGPAERPLISVLSEIDLGKKPKLELAYLRPRIFDPKNLFPSKSIPQGELGEFHKRLWDCFKRECQNLPTASFRAWYVTMNSLLKKYTSTVLSAGYHTVPDIPLYDHLKTTASIAQCLYIVHREDPSTSVHLEKQGKRRFFLFIEGDLSGIQSFIFQTHNAQKAAKRAARRLRGRSFYLYLLTEAVCRKILEELGLAPTSLLWNAGGNFLILAPNTDRVRGKLERLEREITRWMYDEHGTDLYLALYWAEASPEDVRNFGEFKEKNLILHSMKAKYQKYSSLIAPGLFDPKDDIVPEGMHCPVCGGRSKGEEPCPKCERYTEIGSQVVRSDALLIGRGLGSKIRILDVEFELVSRGKPAKSIEEGREGLEEIVFLNSSEFLSPGAARTRVGYSFKYVGVNVPRRDGKPVTFEEMARFSLGPPKLGVLKADVDNLGKVFARGLGERASISRVHFLSTMLDTFFTGYLNEVVASMKVYPELCPRCREIPGVERITVKPETEGSEGPYTVYRADRYGAEICGKCSSSGISTLYITYSGGDDLLIVGPYDHTVEAAGIIREEFRRFTGGNPNLTLSAGIAISGAKFPLQRGVERAEEMLEESKTHIYPPVQEALKDSVTLFGETVLWDGGEYVGNGVKGFKELLEFGRRLEEDVLIGKMSRGLVYSLLNQWYYTWGEIKPEALEKSRLNRKRYVPLVKYSLARNLKDKKAFSYYDNVLMETMPWIRMPVSWASLRTRNRGE
jgi:CRISPR-associated protein Csm1